ncbi:ABC transporter substrate-binding protein [Bartonella ancashensis]|nr:ABC transporter substrate-binding protein [Bartonella ancashensis]
MSVKKNMFKMSSSFVSLFVAMGLLSQQILAKTPADTLVMAWNIDGINTFDPAQLNDVYSNEIMMNICDSLVDSSPDDATKMLPSLAKNWDISGDANTVITFHLRDDLKFFDGRPARAHDLVWSMKRIVKLKMAGAAAFNEYGITEQTVDDAIQKIDDTTIVMKFDKHYPGELILSSIAASRAAMLLDRETIMKHEKDGDMGNKYLATHAACVGDYDLARWLPGELILLRANSNYWGEAPKLKQILIRHVPESETQRLLLQKGDVDVARNLTPEASESLRKEGHADVKKILQPAMFYWGLNMTNPIFANEKVRLAMRYLIDYDGLGETVLKDVGIPRSSFIPIGTLAALDEKEGNYFELNLEKAKQLLNEAGYPDGFEANFLTGNTAYSLLIAQSIQDNAAKVGVRIKIERIGGAQLFSKVASRSFDTVLLGWNSESVDPHAMSSRVIYNPDNRFEAKNTAYPSWQHGYFDEEMNRKVEDALFEGDLEKRVQKYVDLQHEFMEKGPYVFIFQKYNIVATAPSIKKWFWNDMSRIYYNLIEK